MRKIAQLVLAVAMLALLPIFSLPAKAAVSIAGTACTVAVDAGWTVSAALHNNGLIYAAVTSGGLTSGKIRIVVLDPDDPNSTVPGAVGSCNIVASLEDPYPRNNYIKGSSLQIPAIVKADPSGRIFIGRVTTTGFRLYIIDHTAAATPSGALANDKIISIQIIGSISRNNSAGGMDVDANYFVATHGQDKRVPQNNRYTAIPVSTLLALAPVSSAGGMPHTVSSNWYTIKNSKYVQGYTRFQSGTNAVTALGDGRFFIAAAFEGKLNGTLAGFLTPASSGPGTVRNIYTNGNGWADICRNTPRGLLAGNCQIPYSTKGNDGNLYVSFRSHFGEKVMRYNGTTWTSATGAAAYPTSFDKFYPNKRSVTMGTDVAVDSTGQVFTASIGYNRVLGPLNLAYYNGTTWADKSFDGTGQEYGKPQLLIAPYTGETGRLNAFYVRNIRSKPSVVWITYSGTITP